MTFIGIILGAIAGILPGIHPNLINTLLIVFYSNTHLSFLTPLNVSIIIFVMAMTNVIISFIPSTFLGVPDADTALSLLPSHQYLLEGKGHEAVLLTLIGSLTSLLLTIISTPLFALFVKLTYSFIKIHIPFILIIIALSLIIREKSKMMALYTFIASGILGIITLNNQLIKEPLLPLLTGLFGMPTLIMSIFNKEEVRAQQITFPKLEKKKFIKASLISLCTGSFFSFLPSLGPSQAAVFTSLITKETSREAYLILMGSLNTVGMIISIITLYLINKSRNGAVVAISQMIPEMNLKFLLFFIGITLLLSYPVTLLTIVVSRKFSVLITKVNYQVISILIVISITILAAMISGSIGLLVLVTSTAVGFMPLLKNMNRNHLMGCLMLSTIMLYIM